MMMNMWLVIFLMFLFGNMIFVSKHKHLLIVLLSLEFMVLSIFFFLMMYLMMLDYNMYMLMVFLVFSVCEGALGLSILVSMIRTHGNDYFQSYNLI
uniref:NADH-ubiquinone oxidoreductase chain 4L n=15 Tax=Junonia TaxID=39707 RepID=A0A1W5WX04_9NEOP|nr:NADH dehydrogenase subunit 4L [Junonia coenia]YP_009178602.1 NADH dehydrogenase subunit 4L [Junonia lemonias]YP_009346155.1 NADH dehydrogenase subunit 4L [Junonia iphita]YP_009364567.1 NADH dehydrogenase subunit 4L [Junonia litoralis]YP_010417436.1 NADH dehydrogenase subunit 4L [Junonia evarete]YP_010417449.1 NADH dehydrogenase subunit 4L [Junonia adulatrix]YP_010417475.1 NADH dehydrogenase subunit 4L [Junonia atlites]YP_010417527.1 NADH dehydrogenase subunit 4L [Junonia hedonia]YP_01041